jgi:hypothetical protein
MTIPGDLSQNYYMRPLLLLSIIVLGAAVAYPQIPRAGTVHSSVPVAAQPSNSYAHYLPSGYSTAKRWPLLAVFDPFAAEKFSQAIS